MMVDCRKQLWMFLVLVLQVVVAAVKTDYAPFGATSHFVRKLVESVGLPHNSPYFAVPPGSNPPQQVHLTQGDFDGKAVILSYSIVKPTRSGKRSCGSRWQGSKQKSDVDWGMKRSDGRMGSLLCLVIENDVTGGRLLDNLADKQLQYQLVSNPCTRSIIWRMKGPSEDSSKEAATSLYSIRKLICPTYSALWKLRNLRMWWVRTHSMRLSLRHPGFTMCFLINKLQWYLNKNLQILLALPTSLPQHQFSWRAPRAVKSCLLDILAKYNMQHIGLGLDETLRPEIQNRMIRNDPIWNELVVDPAWTESCLGLLQPGAIY